MAKIEQVFQGDFDDFLYKLENGILMGSSSASLEDKSDFCTNGVRCAIRVFERYSMVGSNRVSLNVTLVGNGNQLFLSAISAGGSQAVLFKINTLGESAFLDEVVKIVNNYINKR